MAAGRHGCTRTRPRVRAELQTAQASTRALAAQNGLNPKTVAKWRTRQIIADAPMGPRMRQWRGRQAASGTSSPPGWLGRRRGQPA